jgi:hypothetical protein
MPQQYYTPKRSYDMNVDRSALTALVLFGLLGLGFAVVGLGLNREPAFAPEKKELEKKEPELLPLPRVVATAARSLYVEAAAPGLSVEEIEKTVAQPLERALSGLDGIHSVDTRIQRGRNLALIPGRDE